MVVFYVCFAISIIIAMLSPSFFNLSIVVIYLIMLAFNLFSKVKKYGLITKTTGDPLPFTMVSLYTQDQPEERLAFSISDILGRYFVLAKDEKYLMKMQGRELGGKSFKKLFYANIKDGVFKKDIKIDETDFINS
jgi:hypothetical protein